MLVVQNLDGDEQEEIVTTALQVFAPQFLKIKPDYSSKNRWTFFLRKTLTSCPTFNRCTKNKSVFQEFCTCQRSYVNANRQSGNQRIIESYLFTQKTQPMFAKLLCLKKLRRSFLPCYLTPAELSTESFFPCIHRMIDKQCLSMTTQLFLGCYNCADERRKTHPTKTLTGKDKTSTFIF